MKRILVTLQLTVGQSPVDIGANSSAEMVVISYADSEVYSESTTWAQKFVGKNDEDDLLERYEKVQLEIIVPADAELMNTTNAANSEFRLEVKPKVGAIVPITRVTPAQIDPVMVLK
jgi:archaeal flagellin FlaB